MIYIKYGEHPQEYKKPNRSKISIQDRKKENDEGIASRRLEGISSEKLHLRSYLEKVWSKTGYFELLGNNHILFIILLYPIEG